MSEGGAPAPDSADEPFDPFPGARGGIARGAAGATASAGAPPPSLPGASVGAMRAALPESANADSALSIKSKAGTMSAALPTRSTFGITTRGSASRTSGTTGSGTVRMSWRGCHSAASTVRGATSGWAGGMMDAGDSGISGATAPDTSPERRSTRSDWRSSSGAGAGRGMSRITSASGSPSYLRICIFGRSFVSFLSVWALSAIGVKE